MREDATGTTTPSATIRLSVNLSQDAADALKSITARRGITITQAIRRAISTQYYIEEALDEGARIVISGPGDATRELLFEK
jgi:phosphoribosylcarboxyaminoimidazole (NCAIR) mutase